MEEHREDQISHQPPGISVRKNVYSSPARLFLNRGTQHPDRIDHISDALCSAVVMLSVSLVLEGLQHPSIDVNLLDIRKIFHSERRSTNEEDKEISKYYTIMSVYFEATS